MGNCIRDKKGRFTGHIWSDFVELEGGGAEQICPRCERKIILSAIDWCLRKLYLPTLKATIYEESAFGKLIAGR